jgi:hypothetical protein
VFQPSYLPLRGFDDCTSIGAAKHLMDLELQKIVYRLATLALSSREGIVSGESQPIVNCVDQILALGIKDTNPPELNPRRGKSSLIVTRRRLGSVDEIMEQYLLKICHELKNAQKLMIIKDAGECKGP